MMKTNTTQLVFDAVCDLHAAEQVVTRGSLQDATGLKLTIIDDRLAALIERGEVLRRNRGVFEPAPKHPPARPISKTILPNGMVKIEIGDEVLTLTPREDRYLASLQAGSAMQLASIESGHQQSVVAGEFSLRLRAVEAELGLRTPATNED